MIDPLFNCLQKLQHQIKETPPQQRSLLTKTLDELFKLLDDSVKMPPSGSHDRLETKTPQSHSGEPANAQQAAKIRQLEEQLRHEQNQHRRATQSLTKSEARLQTILRHSADIITVLEADGRVRYHSGAIERILGYSPDERVGKVYGELMHPEDISIWQSYLVDLLEQPGVAKPIAYRQQHQDGSWVYLEAIAHNLLHDFNIKGIVINSRDITTRKQLEIEQQKASQRLQAVIQSSPLAIVAIDDCAKVLSWNAAAKRLFGWCEDEVMGEIMPMIPPEQSVDFYARLESELQGMFHPSQETCRRCKDGSLANVLLWSSPLQELAGKIIGSLHLYSDISEFKRLKEEYEKIEALKQGDGPFWVRYVRPPKRYEIDSE